MEIRIFFVYFSLILMVSNVFGHGAVNFPPPRNNIDHGEKPWSEGVPNPVPPVDDHKNGFWCPVPSPFFDDKLTGHNGQACYWFSNGCSIGCPKCDGKERGPLSIHKNKTDICGLGHKATICDPSLRTVNTGAECGSDEDVYYYSPWRAPGSAPVFDSCGMAGGSPKLGGFGAQYRTTTNAKQGDLGSQTLEHGVSGVFPWQAGKQVHVSWSITANHGGGYQYRLCPEGHDLTEECFQKMPLDFVGQQGFVWADGTTFLFNGTYVTEGTIPKGSKWAMNPVPRNDTVQTGKSFPPRCKEIPNCGSTEVNSKCKCSGMWGPYDMQIVDILQIPKDIKPGPYTLGWRWDCEESTQIWSSCSDVWIFPPEESEDKNEE